MYPVCTGITANLSLRRSVIERVGKFDPLLGACAPLSSGGEPDMLFRVLRAGHKVVNASEVQVISGSLGRVSTLGKIGQMALLLAHRKCQH